MTGHLKRNMPRGQNKGKLLEAGLNLLYSQGFSASGVQEIADASGVPKGSFYNYFKNKEDFGLQVLDYYTENLSGYLEQNLLKAEGSPLSRLQRMFDNWIHKLENRCLGCLAGNLSQELANQNPVFQKALEKSFNKLQSYYSACLEEAKQAGEIDKNANPELLAAFIYNSWQGALVRAKSQGDLEALKDFKKVIFEILLVSIK
ncbi:MAG: TetR family transcriptional regulator C-terminal domain-containing protein [Cyanobacteria bacterium J06636_27]